MINKNYYSEINFSICDILINLYTEYVMHSVLIHKNIKDYLVVLTANTNNTIENNLRNIKNIIDVNKISNTQIISNYKNLCNLYKDFHEKTLNNSTVKIDEFQKIIDSVIPQIKFLNIQEKAYLRNDIPDDDNVNKLLLTAACGLIGIVLILFISLLATYKYNSVGILKHNKCQISICKE